MICNWRLVKKHKGWNAHRRSILNLFYNLYYCYHIFFDVLFDSKVVLSKSPARTPKASAILYSTSSEKGRTMFGASIELKWERLIFAFSANFSCDSPCIFRRLAITNPNSINRSLLQNSTYLIIPHSSRTFYIPYYKPYEFIFQYLLLSY